MFDNNASAFRCVAIAIASENKKLGSIELACTPHEKLPFLDGELVTDVKTVDYDAVDKDGNSSAGTAFVSNVITAKWLPETNRKTAPDVRRGEKVSLWQFAGNDQYYWRSMGLNDDLRRLETVIFAINANPGEGQDGFDPNNMYFIEWSSHNKTVTFSTSKANGEYTAYDFQFDTGNGKVALQDDKGNHIFLDSAESIIRAQNAMNTMFELNKMNIKGVAPKIIELEAGTDFKVSCKKATIDAGGSVLTMQRGWTTLRTPSFKGMS